MTGPEAPVTGTAAGAGAGAGTGTEVFEYALIRVVPRIERGEAINAGVIVYSQQYRYLCARIGLDEDRLRALAPGADADAVRRALGAFTAALAATAGETDDPAQRLAAMGRAYIWFAAGQRPLFDVVNGSGLDKHRYPDLARAYEAVDRVFHDAVRDVSGPDEAAAEALGQALEVMAYGFGPHVDCAPARSGGGPTAERAARATLALIAGRQALTSR